MSNDTNLLGPAELKPLILGIAQRMPDTVNPVQERDPCLGGGHYICLYTDHLDPDRHCVVGQLAADVGWSAPDPYELGPADIMAAEYDWPVTIMGAAFLNRVQMIVDGDVYDEHGGPVPWGKLTDAVLENILLDCA